MTSKNKKTQTTVTLDNIPQDYIKAKYLRPTRRPISMGGFEAGEGDVQVITTSSGRKKVRLTMNGMIRIEPNGDCFILDTPFNRQKLKILCMDMDQLIPIDSTGKTTRTINKGADFSVEDESIFDGLDEVVAQAEANSKTLEGTKAPRMTKGKTGKSIVPASQVHKAEGEGANSSNAEGVGDGRRPEMSAPEGGMDLDIAE